MLLFSIPLLIAARRQSAWQTTPNNSGSDSTTPHLDGVWVLSLDRDPGSPYPDNRTWGKKVMVFKSVGNEVQVSDPETKMTWGGKAHDGTKLTFSFPVKTESSGDPKPVVFDGSVSGNKIVGVAKINNRDVQWSAVKLPSAWECSNHKNPSHIATTEDEMRSLTKQYMCTGWHKLKAM